MGLSARDYRRACTHILRLQSCYSCNGFPAFFPYTIINTTSNQSLFTTKPNLRGYLEANGILAERILRVLDCMRENNLMLSTCLWAISWNVEELNSTSKLSSNGLLFLSATNSLKFYLTGTSGLDDILLAEGASRTGKSCLHQFQRSQCSRGRVREPRMCQPASCMAVSRRKLSELLDDRCPGFFIVVLPGLRGISPRCSLKVIRCVFGNILHGS